MKVNRLRAVHWTLLTLALFVLFLPGIFLHDFWSLLEGRRALVALEMLTRGDWLVPRVMGEPYLTKPPLFYWLESAVFTLFGPADWAARLPSVLAGVVGVLALARLLEGLLGRAGALCGAFVLAMLPLYFWMAQTADLEMLFTAFGIVAMMCFGRLLGLDRPSWKWEAGFYAALALAVLTKGVLCPAMVLLTVQAWLLLQRPRRRLLHVQPALGFALILLPLLAWMGALLLSGCSLAKLFGEAAMHAVQDSSHAEPFYYYFKRIPQLLFPWGVAPLGVLAFALAVATRKNGRAALLAWFRQDRGQRLLLALWFVVSLLLLSAISSKKNYYAVALAAPAAAICALLFHEWIGRAHAGLADWMRRRRGLAIVMMGGFGAVMVGAAIFVNASKGSSSLSGDHWLDEKVFLGWTGVLFLGLAAVALGTLRRGRSGGFARPAMVWTLATLFVLVTVYNFMIHPKLNGERSMERMTWELLARIPAGAPVVTLRESNTICFYWGRADLPTIERLEDLKPYLIRYPGSVALIGGNDREILRRSNDFVFLYSPHYFRDKDDRVYLVGLAAPQPPSKM